MSIDRARRLRIQERLSERGLGWLLLNRLRRSTASLHAAVEAAQARLERRRFLTGPGTLASGGNTIEENRAKWDAHDWSQGGEEWTAAVRDLRGLDPERWKARIISELMYAHLEAGSRVLEVGPGAGRWTEALLERASELHLADISRRCLELCRERFGGREGIHFHPIEKPELPEIADASIDFIWSYDVFVHINPADTASYLRTFERILAPGARAVIHHPGTYADHEERRGTFRSEVDEDFFAHLALARGLRVAVDRSSALAHMPGDAISILEKPRGSTSGSTRLQ